MLNQPLITLMQDLRLSGIKQAYEEQNKQPVDDLSFDERLSLLLEREKICRDDKALALRLKQATLKMQACMENISYKHKRGFIKSELMSLQSCQWLKEGRNILITGACGTGKTYLASALAHKACLNGYKAKYWRLSQLIQETLLAKATNRYINWSKRVSKLDVIILDDFGLPLLDEESKRELLELLDDRYQRRSTIITSQLPVSAWHDYINDPTLADAILDRVVHNAYSFELTGESMRKEKALEQADACKV